MFFCLDLFVSGQKNHQKKIWFSLFYLYSPCCYSSCSPRFSCVFFSFYLTMFPLLVFALIMFIYSPPCLSTLSYVSSVCIYALLFCETFFFFETPLFVLFFLKGFFHLVIPLCKTVFCSISFFVSLFFDRVRSNKKIELFLAEKQPVFSIQDFLNFLNFEENLLFLSVILKTSFLQNASATKKLSRSRFVVIPSCLEECPSLHLFQKVCFITPFLCFFIWKMVRTNLLRKNVFLKKTFISSWCLLQFFMEKLLSIFSLVLLYFLRLSCLLLFLLCLFCFSGVFHIFEFFEATNILKNNVFRWNLGFSIYFEPLLVERTYFEPKNC